MFDDFGDIRDMLDDLTTIQFLIESPSYRDDSYLGSEVSWGDYGEGFPLVAEPTFAFERSGDNPDNYITGALENLKSINNGDSYNANKISVRSSHRLYIDLIGNSDLEITEADRLKDPFGKYYQVVYVEKPMNQQKFYEIYLLEDENYVSQSN